MTAAEERIRAEIQGRGAISFARFMELALYAPGVGYYEDPSRRPGRQGDFYTSVSVGPVFGFLLAFQIAEWCGSETTVQLVEAGAHDGQLAEDILAALERFHPRIHASIRYLILEPSMARQQVQRELLSRRSRVIRWIRDWKELPGRIEGVIFANELLDAFPVRRFRWHAASRSWAEIGVTVQDGQLVECGWNGWEGGSSDSSLPSRWMPPADLAAVLPDGFIVEWNPHAETWWRDAAAKLARGRLVTLDYGSDSPFPWQPERPKGTLRAYFRHTVSSNALERPGEQDLTANVDFHRLIEVGAGEGLDLETLLPQGRWLERIAGRVLQMEGEAATWLKARTRALQTLMHPNHLGAPLKVLIQRTPSIREV